MASHASDAAPVARRRGGPRTAGGKARSARNALKHGLRARLRVLLEDESAADFAALEAGVRAELAPVGGFEQELVMRIVTALWRARRADRLEAAVLGRYLVPTFPSDDSETALGDGVISDGNGPRSLGILARYRGVVLAELSRSLAVLEARQAARSDPSAGAISEVGAAKTKRTPKRSLKTRT